MIDEKYSYETIVRRRGLITLRKICKTFVRIRDFINFMCMCAILF